MRTYQLIYLLLPELKEEEISDLSQKITSLLEKEGILIEKEKPIEINLGYEIKKRKRAFWANLEFQMDPGKIKGLKEKLKKMPQILRFMILGKKTKSEVFPKKIAKKPKKEKKVELKEIEKKLEEILGE